MAGSVGTNVTALEMHAPAHSSRITEKMQTWQGKGSVQGVCGPQKRGEARVLWPSNEQVEQVEREDEYQHWILMNNMKMIKTNCMLTSQGRGGYLGGERQRKQQTNPGKKVTLKSQHFIYFRFMCFDIH